MANTAAKMYIRKSVTKMGYLQHIFIFQLHKNMWIISSSFFLGSFRFTFVWRLNSRYTQKRFDGKTEIEIRNIARFFNGQRNGLSQFLR